MIQLVLYLVISASGIGFHDSYYVVAHFHYVLSSSTINATLLGLLYVSSDAELKWLTDTRWTATGIGMNGLE